jgi:hypothetical protein
MSFNLAVLPILILLLVGGGSMLIVQRRLSKEICRKKLHDVSDLGSLWKGSFPPPAVLTSRGLRILKWHRIFLVVVIAVALGIGLFTGFSNSPIANA